MPICNWTESDYKPCEIHAMDCDNCSEALRPVDVLTEEDYERLNDWIDLYGFTNPKRISYKTYKADINLDKILQVWSEQKDTYLFNLFNGELILERPITYSENIEALSMKFYEGRDNSFWDVESRNFRNTFIEKVLAIIDHIDFISVDIPDDVFLFQYYSRNKSEYLYSLFNANCLAMNRCTDICESNIYFTDGSNIKILHENKLMRVLNKLANLVNLQDDFDKFRCRHSLYTNQKTLNGTLCLSIHPLDYLTMSDNENKWTSCMSWVHKGDYRAGTVEMMNSPCVVCAYLKSDNQTLPFRTHQWNSKKWRELFIVSSKFITEIKPYPYSNTEFTQIVLTWLKELAYTNLHWTYSDTSVQYRGGSDEPEILPSVMLSDVLYISSDLMYNDFGDTAHGHTMYLNDDFYKGLQSQNYIFNYSGPTTCMCCGCISTFMEASYVACSDCDESGYQCCCCGDLVSEDYICWGIDDEAYCEYCFNDNFTYDDIWQEYDYKQNISTLQILGVPTTIYISTNIERLMHNIRTETNPNFKIAKSSDLVVPFDEAEYVYTINMQDLTPYGQNLIY